MKVVLKHDGRWLHFQSPEKTLVSHTPDDVLPMLEEAQQSGFHVAGFVSYEAASAFDPALKTHPMENFPLLCLGLFPPPDVLEEIEQPVDAHYEIGALNPSISMAGFETAIGKVKEHIATGATYQVNHTYRLNAAFSGDAWAFFHDLVKGQRTEHAAFIEYGDISICSASPELFFSVRDGRIVSRPMKGTARRGRTLAEDWRMAERLRTSEKDCAENIMIVDMVRNDIGRIAEPGSVETVSMFDIEKYPTVWQMTSTVSGWLGRRSLSDIFKALFPCASITGAPKAKTMEIIRELETSPRKIYTGAIGFSTPSGEVCFNVAIRTALIQNGSLEFGVGGGIVWDSDADAEYEETLTKARVLTEPRPDFKLLETMLWEPENGIFLLDGHLQRLGKSSAYFDVPMDMHEVLERLEQHVGGLAQVPHRIRLLVSREGEMEIESVIIETGRACSPSAPRTDHRSVPILRVAIAKAPVDSQDVFLFHKTTHRVVYDSARKTFPDCDDVVLWNERGEVTEGTIANIVVRKEGRLVTPPVECGLLAGTFREHLLKSGEIEEGIVTLEDLRGADDCYLVNSVRGWMRVDLEEVQWPAG